MNARRAPSESNAQGWIQDMRAWFALTRGTTAAAEDGIAVAPDESVAPDKGRQLLERLSYPKDIEHHFVVDPVKYDFCRMDALREVGENRLAERPATEVIRAGTDFDGTERSPTRIAQVRITPGMVAAREGDLDTALAFGEQAITVDRKSPPSPAMVTTDLGQDLRTRYDHAGGTREFGTPPWQRRNSVAPATASCRPAANTCIGDAPRAVPGAQRQSPRRDALVTSARARELPAAHPAIRFPRRPVSGAPLRCREWMT